MLPLWLALSPLQTVESEFHAWSAFAWPRDALDTGAGADTDADAAWFPACADGYSALSRAERALFSAISVARLLCAVGPTS